MTVSADKNGNLLSAQRYTPWGSIRAGSAPTTFGYTGQSEQGFGLLDYNARFYSPYLGRFISPDTLVPDPYNSLDWDRYAFVRNNPSNFVDPSGHDPRPGQKGDYKPDAPVWSPALISYGITIFGEMAWEDKQQIQKEVQSMTQAIAPYYCIDNENCSIIPDYMIFKKLAGDVTISMSTEAGSYCHITSGNIECFAGASGNLSSSGWLVQWLMNLDILLPQI